MGELVTFFPLKWGGGSLLEGGGLFKRGKALCMIYGNLISSNNFNASKREKGSDNHDHLIL